MSLNQNGICMANIKYGQKMLFFPGNLHIRHPLYDLCRVFCIDGLLFFAQHINCSEFRFSDFFTPWYVSVNLWNMIALHFPYLHISNVGFSVCRQKKVGVVAVLGLCFLYHESTCTKKCLFLQFRVVEYIQQFRE